MRGAVAFDPKKLTPLLTTDDRRACCCGLEQPRGNGLSMLVIGILVFCTIVVVCRVAGGEYGAVVPRRSNTSHIRQRRTKDDYDRMFEHRCRRSGGNDTLTGPGVCPVRWDARRVHARIHQSTPLPGARRGERIGQFREFVTFNGADDGRVEPDDQYFVLSRRGRSSLLRRRP